MTDKLKPCPFCGADAQIIEDHDYDDVYKYFVKCDSCHSRGGDIASNCARCGRERAGDAWNRRVGDKELTND